MNKPKSIQGTLLRIMKFSGIEMIIPGTFSTQKFLVSLFLCLCLSPLVSGQVNITVDQTKVASDNFHGFGINISPTYGAYTAIQIDEIFKPRVQYMRIPFTRFWMMPDLHLTDKANANSAVDWNEASWQTSLNSLAMFEGLNTRHMLTNSKKNFESIPGDTDWGDPQWSHLMAEQLNRLRDTGYNFIGASLVNEAENNTPGGDVAQQAGWPYLDTELTNFGIRSQVDIIGGEGADSWGSYNDTYCDGIGGHPYPSDEEILTGSMEQYARQRVNQIDASKVVYWSEFAQNDWQNRAQHGHGVANVDMAVQGVNGGLESVMLWRLDDSGTVSSPLKYHGLWRRLSDGARLYPKFFIYSLMSRYVPFGSTSYDVDSPDNRVRVTAIQKDGQWTFILVNRANSNRTINLKVLSGPTSITLDKYDYVNSDGPANTNYGNYNTDACGFPVKASTLTNINLANGYNLTLPDNSVILLTNVSVPAPPTCSGGIGDTGGIYEAENLAYTANGANTGVSGDGNTIFLEGNSVNDWIEFTLPNIAAGTYEVEVDITKFANGGIAQTSIDGTELGNTIDTYNGASTADPVVLGNRTFSSTGNKIVRFTVSGKNSSSSGYKIGIDKIKLTLTTGGGGNVSGPFFLVNRGSGSRFRPKGCSDIDDESIEIMQVSKINTGTCVQWETIDTDSGWFYLRNVSTGKYISPEGCSSADDESVTIRQVSTTNDGTCTQWKKVATDNGWFYLQNRATGKYIRPLGWVSTSNETVPLAQVSTSFQGNWTQFQLAPVGTNLSTNITSNGRINVAIDESRETIEESESVLYPNPAATYVNLNLYADDQSSATITICDLRGIIILEKKSTIHKGNSTVQLSINEIPEGIYILTVKGLSRTFSKKLVVDR